MPVALNQAGDMAGGRAMAEATGVRVRPLVAEDLDDADRICRVAFGTFAGAPEPERFFGDADMVRTRWRTDPGAALAADLGGQLAGSNFAANWGSVGYFGPLTVAPEHWDQAIAQRLLDATMDLDLSREIASVRAQRLGDTVLIDDGTGLQGMAVCHVGAGTEAGSDVCYVKFGAVRPGPGAERRFGLLIDACDSLAAEHGVAALMAGTNLGREQAWRALADRGFRAIRQGVTMHRPNEAGYSTTDAFVIDDWR